MGQIRVKGHTRTRNGRSYRVKSYLRKDVGAPGRTPKEKRFFRGEISLEGLNYDVTDADSTRQGQIREWAKKHGNGPKAWMTLFHHFHGLANLTARSNPKAARVFRKDAKYIDSVRERRFGSQ